jgi:restriction endonuclease S subunit
VLWKTYKLTEKFDIIKGTSSAQNETPGDYPMVVTAEARKSSQNYQFDGEAVCVPLVSSTGHGNAAINRLHYQTGKFAVASILAAITPKSNEIDCKYLYYYLTALKDRILVPLMKGTSNVSLTVEKLKSLSIEAPSIHEQRVIVNFLDNIQTDLKDRSSLLDEVDRDTDAMLHKAFNEIINGAEYQSLAKVAPLVRREIDIDANMEYTEIGVRSFYNGIFHRRTMLGTEFSWQKLFRIKADDLVFSNLMAWEQAIAIANSDDDGCVGNHRMLTCQVNTRLVAPKFLMFYFRTKEGFTKVVGNSPGSIARNKTLSSKLLPKIAVPVPNIEAQRCFDKLCSYVTEIRSIRAVTAKEAEALLSAMLHEIFERKAVAPIEATTKQNENIISLLQTQPTSIDTPFKEAVLVGAIIKAFHEEGGQPLGNFRLQKAVYFARRFMGERALDQDYLRKAAGPYNPTMRYSGGIKIALENGWISAAAGKYGPGHSPGSAFDDASVWIKNYQFAKPAAWVRDKFKFKHNDIWELLATVDYAILALEHSGSATTAADVFAYIGNDPEWCQKIEKLQLSEASIQNAMVELQSLFEDVAM